MQYVGIGHLLTSHAHQIRAAYHQSDCCVHTSMTEATVNLVSHAASHFQGSAHFDTASTRALNDWEQEELSPDCSRAALFSLM